jgi:hypothetical protein
VAPVLDDIGPVGINQLDSLVDQGRITAEAAEKLKQVHGELT